MLLAIIGFAAIIYILAKPVNNLPVQRREVVLTDEQKRYNAEQWTARNLTGNKSVAKKKYKSSPKGVTQPSAMIGDKVSESSQPPTTAKPIEESDSKLPPIFR